MVVATSCLRFNPSTPLTAAPSVPVLALPLTDDEEEEDEGEGGEDTDNDDEETVVVAHIIFFSLIHQPFLGRLFHSIFP